MTQNRKITVAFFLPSLEPGGTERNVVHLVNTINKEKYAVSLVLGMAHGDFMQEINSDIPVVSLGVSHSITTFFSLITYFKKNQPDIFVSAFPRINIICISAKIFSGVKTKIIISEHSIFSMLPVIAKTFWRRLFARFFMPWLGRLMYPKADAIICVSQGVTDDLSNIVKDVNKIKVIYNPVIDENIYQLAKEPLDHPWFSDNNIPVIIAVGRLVACKDYPTLFKAFGQVLKEQPSRLVILGKGPEKEKLVNLVDQMGIAQHVIFLGFRPNPYKYMKRGSVFALSSLQEGFGNAIIEAMACGVPVVSTDCPTGPGEIIEHMKNGILVPVGKPQQMAQAILTVLENPALAQKLSVEGEKRAKFFSVEKSVKEYEKIFQELIC